MSRSLHRYTAYGLRVQSPIALPFVPASSAPHHEPDVTIRVGAAPLALPAPVDKRGHWQSAPGAFLLNVDGVARIWSRQAATSWLSRTAAEMATWVPVRARPASGALSRRRGNGGTGAGLPGEAARASVADQCAGGRNRAVSVRARRRDGLPCGRRFRVTPRERPCRSAGSPPTLRNRHEGWTGRGAG